ncbi:roadblock/LC7 domain-containing protein [Deinococcus puniceus]|uniref:Roadblock/LAMTOR2 domain-containing protein n=1 Tax=Deinococcus puniceus TaxID=1182568 RepID=A0A172T9P2_9DEIO|nr:roadblock/LC7 domain-containing protein [Deinococcus puniceus]ANE43748.1 hypothetical protein SU48_08165 [Deinococcus puniceus]
MKLEPLHAIPGVVASALVGPDGLPIEMYGEAGDALAAELASLRASLDRTGRRLGAGEVTRMAFTSERVEVVALSSGEFVLGAAMLRGSDTRAAQQALARLALDLTDLPKVDDA